jgi:hypothetical protein
VAAQVAGLQFGTSFSLCAAHRLKAFLASLSDVPS